MKTTNREFSRKYKLVESIECGIVLTGAETKQIAKGQIKLEDAHVKILGNELFLVNAEVPIYKFARPDGYNQTRSRKLLLHRSQITRLQSKLASGAGLTLAPVSCYNKGPKYKIEVALVKGQKTKDRKSIEKQKEEKREQEKELKEIIQSRN